MPQVQTFKCELKPKEILDTAVSILQERNNKQV